MDIIIVGAGLGGLGASISCALAGHRVIVLESAKELTEIGAGLQITPNASRILQEWGLGKSIDELGAEPTSLTVHRYKDGKILAHEENFNVKMRQRYGAPFVDMYRVDLQKLLYDKAIDLGVDVKLGERVASVRHEGEAAVVLDTGKVYTGDLVVGADGLWSRCRNSLLQRSDNPLPTGDLAYRIVLARDQLKEADLHDWVTNPAVHFWIGPCAHAAAYSLRAGTIYNIVLVRRDDLPDKITRQSASVDEMRALFADWDPILTRFLDRVVSVDKWKLMHREELESWTNAKGTCVLIGDSCHPMLPYLAQGANSALEDGAVLGRLLGHVTAKSQLCSAITLYEKLRQTRSKAIIQETFQQRNTFHMLDGPEQEERDKIFLSQLGKEITGKFPSRWTCPDVQRWLYGYDANKEADAAAISITRRPQTEAK